jgi:hypothetical protein
MPKVLSVFLAVVFLAVQAPAVEYSFTHFAGTTGGGGYQDGVGGAARFYRPIAIAMDRNGYVYVGDTNTIRRVSPTGNVTTFAGKWRDGAYINGTAGAARIGTATGIVLDSTGNLFFVDSCTIRKITAAGVVSTFAGSPGACTVIDNVGTSARFYFPQGIAIDTADNLYVAEASHTIRKILTDGTVSTLAGTPFSTGTLDATGSAARFNLPSGVVVDSSGNVVVADRNNHTIRRITPAGVVSTLAGLAGSANYLDGTGSAARFLSPVGLTIDSSDNVFVVEGPRHAVRQVTPGGVVTTVVGSAFTAGAVDANGLNARFFSPRGIVVDRRGGFFVADTFNNTIRKVSATLDVTTLAGAVPEKALVNGTGTSARFGFPRDVTTDAAGNLYVTDGTFDVIRVITPAGVVTSFTGGNGTWRDGRTGGDCAVRRDHRDRLGLRWEPLRGGCRRPHRPQNHPRRRRLHAGRIVWRSRLPGSDRLGRALRSSAQSRRRRHRQCLRD